MLMVTVDRRRNAMGFKGGVIVAIAALWAAAGHAHAQPAPQTGARSGSTSSTTSASTSSTTDAPVASSDRLTLRVQPVAWYAGYSGNLRMPGQSLGSSNTTIGELDADNTRLIPAGDVRISSGDWTFGVAGTAYSISDRSSTIGRGGEIGTIAFNSGDTLKTSLDFALLEATVAYRVGHWEFDDSAKGGIKVVPSIYLFGGARVYDLQYDITRTQGGTLSVDRTFIEVVGGARGSLALHDRFSVDVQIDWGGMGGGDRSSFSWDVIAGFSWRPIENVGVLVGYRNLAFDLESGEGTGKFRHDGAMAGLYFGLDLRF